MERVDIIDWNLKVGQRFQLQIAKKIIMVIISTGAFCVWVKVLREDFSTELT